MMTPTSSSLTSAFNVVIVEGGDVCLSKFPLFLGGWKNVCVFEVWHVPRKLAVALCSLYAQNVLFAFFIPTTIEIVMKIIMKGIEYILWPMEVVGTTQFRWWKMVWVGNSFWKKALPALFLSLMEIWSCSQSILTKEAKQLYSFSVALEVNSLSYSLTLSLFSHNYILILFVFGYICLN